MSKLFKKKNNKGFTLIETVVALILVTMITGLLLVITNLAKDTYFDMQMSAEGQILSSTLMAKVQDELRYASDLSVNTTSSGRSSSKIAVEKQNNVTTKEGYGYTYTFHSDILGYSGSEFVQENGVLYVESQVNRISLTGNSAYVFDLAASIESYYVPTYKDFYVNIRIYDKVKGTTIIDNIFIVEPLNKNVLPGETELGL